MWSKFAAMNKVTLKRVNNRFHFKASDNSGRVIDVDSSPALGGEEKGFRPMDLLLISAGGCASIDLGLILEKQRQQLDDYSVAISGDRNEDKIKAYNSILFKFDLVGDLEESKVVKAIELTIQKYCSVIQSLNPAIDIKYEYTINSQE